MSLVLFPISYCSTEPFPRKGTETISRLARLPLSRYAFNRTLSPQGDGNPIKSTCFCSFGDICCLFNRTLSPQGDGNQPKGRSRLRAGQPLSSSTEPFPRKGTETVVAVVIAPVPANVFNRTLSPQGDGNATKNKGFHFHILLKFNRTLSPQGDGN